jgi:hypothetical protein
MVQVSLRAAVDMEPSRCSVATAPFVFGTEEMLALLCKSWCLQAGTTGCPHLSLIR